ncbi:MAG: acyl-CoA dehydrogenase [Bacteroidota bacterium]
MGKYMSVDTLKWLLYDVHNVKDLYQYERYADYDDESVNILLDTAKSWADQEFFPIFREMDEHPCEYKDGKVTSHPNLRKIISKAGQDGWLGSSFDYDDGGSQMPHLVVNALNHIFQSANNHIPGYMGLTTGAADLIRTFGAQELKDKYIPNMIAGKWGGTMCLTEPQAGSSLSDITTSAAPQEDGSYKITGQKIFISGGDHEGVDNFVHLVLARIDGAPAGTKGISLFVVPKHRITESGELEYNDVFTAGDFQKMGQRGYSTVHLVFGENDNCVGHLVGGEHQGLKNMFQMMNGARIDVGMTAASTATAAYYASLQYAKERPQGRKIQNSGKKDPNSGQTLIINHPDVRRMLLLQKAINEGSLCLLLETAKLVDLAHVENGDAASDSHLLLELLTPIAKTYPSEKGQEAISNGLQIFGGYGFCMDFPLQQYYRDIRIMSLYEGTTGIQSLDLLGRKVTLQNGAALQLLMKKVNEVTSEANNHDDLKPYADKLLKSVGYVQRALEYLLPMAMKGDYESFLADATAFMQMTSNIVIAYQWLKMATRAKHALVTGNTSYSSKFYENKIHTMKFYYKYELPHARAHLETILNDEELTIVNEGNEIFA